MLTAREWKAVKAGIAQYRYATGERASAPGPSDGPRRGPDKVTNEEMRELRGYVAAVLADDRAAKRRYGRAA